MLVAYNAEQQLVQLQRTLSKEQLQQWRQQLFYCPQCNAPLQLKAGQIRIPHFSHLKKSACETMFSERESPQHLLGKQHLYALFEKLQLSPKLEPYFPQLKQRPDLFVTWKNRSFAIEFQCSPLSQQRFLARTKGYVEANMTPIWIVYLPESKTKEVGVQKITLNYTLAQYFRHHNSQYYLLLYQVEQRQFYYFSHLIHLKKTQYVGVVSRLPLMQQQFPLLVAAPLSLLQFEQLMTNIFQFRADYLQPRLLLSKRGVKDPFLRAIYELKLVPLNLPHIVGIPVQNTNSFEDYCIEWQVQLFYFLKSHALTPQTMHEQSIAYFLQWANLSVTMARKQEVVNYLRLLRQLNVQHVHSAVEKGQLIAALYKELVAIG